MYRLSALIILSVGLTSIAQAKTAAEQRGEYLSRAADCVSCHSVEGKPPFSGGTELKTKFGSLFGSNITPDPDTGIGRWTRDDFDRAVRRGIRKDGSYLYPGMPFTNYTKMSDNDLDDLWAYLRTVKPVHNVPPANTLIFPMSVRASAAAWQTLFFKPGRFVDAQGKSAEWNRGAYLLEALGHCDSCHSPRNLLQAPEKKKYLTGAQVENWYAPDIGSDPLSSVSQWSVDELAAFLKTGRDPGNHKTFGPMQSVIHNSLAYLTAKDLRAMAVFLKDQPARPTTPSTNRVTFEGEMPRDGKAVYSDHCATCHGDQGKGIAGVVPALAGNSAVIAGDSQNVVTALLEGFVPQGTWGAMASFADILSDAEIAAVSNYVRTSWSNAGKADATAVVVGRLRAQSQGAQDAHGIALLCPNLPAKVMSPALRLDAASYTQAADSNAKLTTLVNAYDRANPEATPGETIQALSSAYCRTVAHTGVSRAVASAKIARFSQRVAIALAR